MKLTVLTENCAGPGFLAEHGLSYLIETESDKILFDTGHSDTYIKNASLLGIHIHKEIDTIILSHGHWDHGDGLKYLKNKTLITHPDSFIKRYRKVNRSYIGLNLTKKEIEKQFILKTSKTPFKINEQVIFLGEIPKENDFEARSTSFIDDNGKPDFVPDDSALAIIEDTELIVVTGCSHAGICNIIDYAKKVSGIEKVRSVIGGFHLKFDNKQTKETIQYLKRENIKNIYPSHCTELKALTAIAKEFTIIGIKTGMILNL